MIVTWWQQLDNANDNDDDNCNNIILLTFNRSEYLQRINFNRVECKRSVRFVSAAIVICVFVCVFECDSKRKRKSVREEFSYELYPWSRSGSKPDGHITLFNGIICNKLALCDS